MRTSPGLKTHKHQFDVKLCLKGVTFDGQLNDMVYTI